MNGISIKLLGMNDSPNQIEDKTITEKLHDIHCQYVLHENIWNNNTFLEEIPEQKMVVRYLTGNEKVLEIGSNIGRNTIVIGHILQQRNNKNFVSLESSPQIFPYVVENVKTNNISCHNENSALSKRPLIQTNTDTIVVTENTIIPKDSFTVNVMTYEELLHKYQINFDTLILDCEGAFYYILMDMPEILTNINLIIMENDYGDFSHKQYIDGVLKANGFHVDYVESGGWGPCFHCFFEVWVRTSNLADD